LEEELRNAFGAEAEVELVAGSGGVYEISVDGRNIFSKKQQGRFPDDGEIVALIKQ
jgi:selenoprotein W-related protein